MNANDRRLLQANAAAIKLVLDSLVDRRITMVNLDRARELAADLGAALAEATGGPVPAPTAQAVAGRPSPVAGGLLGWWVRRRVQA